MFFKNYYRLALLVKCKYIDREKKDKNYIKDEIEISFHDSDESDEELSGEEKYLQKFIYY